MTGKNYPPFISLMTGYVIQIIDIIFDWITVQSATRRKMTEAEFLVGICSLFIKGNFFCVFLPRWNARKEHRVAPGSRSAVDCGWKQNEAACEAIYASEVLTARRRVYIPRSMHQPSRCCCLSDVSEALSSCSFQGNMCAGILPQLRQGLAGSSVGTGRVWESRALVPSLIPSLTLSLILTRFCSSS